MTTTLSLRKILHRPQWEMCNPLPAASAAGSFVKALQIPAYALAAMVFAINTTSSLWWYNPVADTELNMVASGMAGTFGAGSCGRIHTLGPSGTATAGSTTTVTTNLTIVRDLRGLRIRITAGPGAGDERVIASNTIGANSVITVTTAFIATITTSSVYQIISPRLWVYNPAATPGLSYYDWALNTWTSRVTTGTTFTGTDGCLVSTDAIRGNKTDSSDAAGGVTFGSFSSATLTLSAGRNWVTNEWANGIMTVIGGTGAGQVRTIASNTNLAVVASSAWTTPLDSTSVWILTKAFASSSQSTFSAASGTTLTVTGAAWTTNMWANAQIRIVAGLGVGQTRVITSNTGTVLTVPAWTTNPDATSVWVIEGDDNALYLAGNAAVALYKYSISGNTWATATATAARAAVTGAGLSLNWITNVSDSTWTSQTNIKNGRYLYSFRGNAGAVLDVYDLALTTWTSGVSYGNAGETFSTGTCYEYDGRDNLYVATAAGRMYRFDFVLNALEPSSEITYPQSTAIVGDKLAMFAYYDGSTRVDYLYHWRNTGVELFRLITWHTYGG